MKSRKLFLAATALAAAITAAMPARAADEPTPRINVTGEGQVFAAPDMALVNLTVLREGETAKAALDANSKAMADVLAAMKEQGIAEKDMQTTGFSIQPRYVYPDQAKEPNAAPKIVGYTVINSLGLRVRDLSKAGDILDRAVTLGVNQGGDIQFLKDETTALLEEARKKAVENAVSKAKTMAAAAGVSVGRVLDMSEQSFMPGPMPMMQAEMAMAKMASDAAPVPMAAGENAYRVTVNVSFEIKQ